MRQKQIWLRVILSIILLMIPVPIFANPIAVPSKDAGWLETLNYYRVSSGVEPVIENPVLSANAMRHSIYLAKSDPKYLTGIYENPHSENPESPYYTKEGADSGTNLTYTARESDAIDSWMQAPLHAIGLLRDNLKTTGYATAINDRTGQAHTGLDVINGLVGSRRKIITFPGNGAVVRLNKFYGESPDPRESCGKDWEKFRGLPIFASFASTPPRDITGKIETPLGKTLLPGDDLCVVTQYSWVSTDRVISYGNQIMAGEKLVLLIAKSPLSPGEHSVSVSGTGISPLNWKFTVLQPLPKVSYTFNVDKELISWGPATVLAPHLVAGYTVIAWDRTWNKSKEYRTKELSLSTVDWPAAEYWICVKVRSSIDESECDSYYLYAIDRKPKRLFPIISYYNPDLVTWDIKDFSNATAKLDSITVQLRSYDGGEVTKSESINPNEGYWKLPDLKFGDYEVCVLAINSYGVSSCDWERFVIQQRKIPKFNLDSKSIKVGKSAFLDSESDVEPTFTLLSSTTCEIKATSTGIRIIGLKAGTCSIQVTSATQDLYFAHNESISIGVFDQASNATTKKMTIKCAKKGQVKTVIGFKPKCPVGYKKVP